LKEDIECFVLRVLSLLFDFHLGQGCFECLVGHLGVGQAVAGQVQRAQLLQALELLEPGAGDVALVELELLELAESGEVGQAAAPGIADRWWT
jgi:hypothetical protein